MAICCAEGKFESIVSSKFITYHSSSGIFMIRTCAVWNRNRSVGFVLLALACGVGVVFLAELYLLALSTTKLQGASFAQKFKII